MVYQVMESLGVGDGVSEIARRNAALLAELGQPAKILVRHAERSLRRETEDAAVVRAHPDAALFFHYWGRNDSLWMLDAVRGRKAVCYHNMTPPAFFVPGSALHRNAVAGREQLRAIADAFDVVAGASRYNAEEFARHTTRGQPVIPLHPVVEPAELRAAPYDRRVVDAVRGGAALNVVFVGRLARNKRQDRLMEVFDYYHRHVARDARLWLVGDDRFDPAYTEELRRLHAALPSAARITFTGKVPAAALHAYQRAADVVLCASEHEGFCLPLAHAMALDVPVIAHAAAAVPETVGDGGLLVHDWDTARVAELMHLVVTDAALRARLVQAGREAVRRFSAAEARRRLAGLVAFLEGGKLDSLSVDAGDGPAPT